jgi:guanylate kinase
MVADDRFAEWAHVHGNCYGTANQIVSEALAMGRDLVFDIDYQGAASLRKRYPADTTSVFVLPPNMSVLEQRLRGRGTETETVVAQRLGRARAEIEQFSSFDYLVINDDLERCYRDFQAIYLAAHCSRKRQSAHARRLLSKETA